MTTDEVNSVMGKQLAIQGQKKEELIQWGEPVGPKQGLNLSSIWTYLIWTYLLFFNKEEEGFWPGHDERLKLCSIWT